MSIALSVIVALTGFTLQSTGLVLTKAGAAWLSRKGERDARFRRSRNIWLFGFLLFNLTFFFTALASRTLPPHVISAASGWGIPVLVFLSHSLLKESIYPSDFLYAAGIMGGIALLSILEKPSAGLAANERAYSIMMLLPLAVLLPLPLLKHREDCRRTRIVLLSVFAGLLAGCTIVTMTVMIRQLPPVPVTYLRSPYPYVFILAGTVSFIALQLALRLGTMIMIGPLQNAFLIIYPAVCSWVVFGVRLGLGQIAAIAAILVCSIAILRRH